MSDSTESLPASIQRNAPILGVHYRGLSRSKPIEPCTLSIEDMRRLYALLDAKAQEALERHLAALQVPPGNTPEEFERLKDGARQMGALTVTIEGQNGEQVAMSAAQALSDQHVPEGFARVTFDSAASMQVYNVALANRFTLKLDFREPPGFDAYNPWDQSTPNESELAVSGPDSTWVTGVFEEAVAFLNKRRRKRAWLHSHGTFNLAHWLVGLPASLWIMFRVDQKLQGLAPGMHPALKGAFYVYVFLLSLLVFRIIIYSFRWLFPVIELEGARNRATRGLLGAVLGSLLLAVLYDVLKAIVTQ